MQREVFRTSGKGVLPTEAGHATLPDVRNLAGLTLGLFACGSPAARQADPVAEEGSLMVPKPGIQTDGSVVTSFDFFEGSLEEALAEAGRAGKLVLVEVGAYWCAPCHVLEEKVLTDPRVGELVRAHFVALRIDAEKGEGPELTDHYQVMGYPTVLVLEPTGVERGRVGELEEGDVEGFIRDLAELRDGKNILAELEASALASPKDPAKRYAFGRALGQAGQRTRAEVEYAAVLEADPDDTLSLASRVLFDRGMFAAKIDGDPEAAILRYRELQARFPRSKSAVSAYRQIGRALHRLNRTEEAIASLDAMLATDPTSVDLKSSYGWFSFRERCDPARGLVVVRDALKTAPENADFHYLEAELSALLGDLKRAREAISEAARLEPGSAFYRRQVARFEGMP
jgi:thiol-disulfide isomerase/thioredoxin